MTNLRNNTITTFCVGCLSVYFLCNAIFIRQFPSPARLPFSLLEIKTQKSSVLTLSVPEGLTFRGHVDGITSRIAQWGSLLRFGLGQLRTDALWGTDKLFQWIFLREEAFFQYRLSEAWVKAHYTDVLLPFMNHAESLGAKVVVVPVPTKLSIERESLLRALTRPEHPTLSHPANSDPQLEEDSYASYEQLVHSDGRMVNLYKSFMNYKRLHPKEDIYQPMDTHWASLGIVLAAQAVSEHVTQKQPLPIVHEGFRDARYNSSFFEFLQLSPDAFKGLSKYAWREPLYQLKPQAQVAGKSQRLVAIGSSYSEYMTTIGYSFPQVLAKALGRELIMEWDTGDRFGLRALSRLTEKGYRVQKGDLIVFEFPFRFPWPEETVLPLLNIAKTDSKPPFH